MLHLELCMLSNVKVAVRTTGKNIGHEKGRRGKAQGLRRAKPPTFCWDKAEFGATNV